MVKRNARRTNISYLYTHAPEKKKNVSRVRVNRIILSSTVLGKIVDKSKSPQDFHEISNIVYNVTKKTGKSVYYLTPIIEQDVGSRKIHNGWNCIVVPCSSNYEDKSQWYKYKELDSGLIEVEWFNSDSDILSYEKIKDEEFYIEQVPSYHLVYNSGSDEEDDDTY